MDIFRLVCAVLVVAIHTEPLKELPGAWGYYALVPAKIAVPFFFAAAGYYYILSLLAGKKVFVKTVKRLLAVYLIWSAVYFAIDFVKTLASGSSIPAFALRCLKQFFITGSMWHLWFFPALFFTLFTVTLAHKVKLLRLLAWISLPLYGAGCLLRTYGRVFDEVPAAARLLSWPYLDTVGKVIFSGLPFFLLGYFLNIYASKTAVFPKKAIAAALCASAAAYLAETALIVAFEGKINFSINFTLYALLAFLMLYLLRNPLAALKSAGRYARTAANFTFYSQYVFIFLFAAVGLGAGTSLFVLTSFCTALGGLAIAKIDNKTLNRLVF